MEPWRSELYHYGILGMKWGIRRYQNPDGTLTAAGREHYQKKLKKYNDIVAKAESKKQKINNRVIKARSKADKKTSRARDLESRLLFTTDINIYFAKRGEAHALKALSRAEKAKYKNKNTIEKYTKKGEMIINKYFNTENNNDIQNKEVKINDKKAEKSYKRGKKELQSSKEYQNWRKAEDKVYKHYSNGAPSQEDKYKAEARAAYTQAKMIDAVEKQAYNIFGKTGSDSQIDSYIKEVTGGLTRQTRDEDMDYYNYWKKHGKTEMSWI